MTRLYVPVRLRWSDLDAYAHVNNVEMFRLLEEARITAFWKHPLALDADVWPTAVLDSGPAATSHTLVARQEIEYLRPLSFTREPVRVEMWIGKIGAASLDVCYEVHDDGGVVGRSGPATAGAPYARASTTIVVIDAASGRPRRFDAVERGAWEPFREEPVVFQRR